MLLSLQPSGVRAVAAELESAVPAVAPERVPLASSLTDRLKVPAAGTLAPALDPYPQLRELDWRLSALVVPLAAVLPRAEPRHRALTVCRSKGEIVKASLRCSRV